MKRIIGTIMTLAAAAIATPLTAEAKVNITTYTNGDVKVEALEDGTNSVYIDGTVLEAGQSRTAKMTTPGTQVEVVNNVTNSGGTLVSYNGSTRSTTVQSVSVTFYEGGNSKVTITEDAAKKVDFNGTAVEYGKTLSSTESHSRKMTVYNGMSRLTGTIASGNSSSSQGSGVKPVPSTGTIEATVDEDNKISLSKLKDWKTIKHLGSPFYGDIKFLNNCGAWYGTVEKTGYKWDGHKWKKVKGKYFDPYSMGGVRSDSKASSGYITRGTVRRTIKNMYGNQLRFSKAQLKDKTKADKTWIYSTLISLAEARHASDFVRTYDNYATTSDGVMKCEYANIMAGIIRNYASMDPREDYTYAK